MNICTVPCKRFRSPSELSLYATSVVSVLFYQVPKPIFHPSRAVFTLDC